MAEVKIWQIVQNPLNIKIDKNGRPRTYKSPQDLWNKFIDYCKYVDDNPWIIKAGGSSTSTKEGEKTDSLKQDAKPLQRAYTLIGFCAFAGIGRWVDFKRSYLEEKQTKENIKAKIKGFSTVIIAIENIIQSQQIDGALLHQFDSNLVSRLNGIADKTINEITGKDGEPLILPKLSKEDLEELAKINGL